MQNVIEGLQLSHQQRHLWSLQDENIMYCAQCTVRLEGVLDVAVLKEAVQSIISRHEILRTHFLRLPGMKVPVQVITNNAKPLWHYIDLQAQDSLQQEAEIKALFKRQQHQPFDFEQGPLLRFLLFSLAKRKHILLINLSALCADAWTLRNLVQEISHAYAACLQGERLSDESTQYIAFSEWQIQLLEDEDAELGKSYWRQCNHDTAAAVTLPFERRSLGRREFEPVTFESMITPEIAERLRVITHTYDTTLAIVLLACWQMLLWRLTGQRDIVISKLCDGRRYEELHGAFGLFAKYLPVHCYFERNFLFGEVLEQVQESARAAYQWQEYFVWEGHEGMAEDGAGTPIGFDFDMSPAQWDTAGLSFSIDSRYVNFDRLKLKLSCLQVDDSITAEFHYDASLFRHDDVQCLAEQFHTLLSSLTSTPEVMIGDLAMLSGTERHRLLVLLNSAQIDYPKDVYVHNLIEEQARRVPNSKAVVFEAQHLSYAELNRRANQLAHYLKKLGVGPEVRVAMCMERSSEVVIGLLGILKAGGAYVPLDPAQPKERLAFMLTDAQPAILLAQQRLESRLPEIEMPVLYLDRDWNVIAQRDDENPDNVVTGGNLAYVMYTSGSTGRPKGVAIAHQQLLNYLHAISQRLDLPVGASFAMVSSFAADLGNTALFPSLCFGGCLHVISQERVSDPELFADYFGHHTIDCLKVAPSHLEAMLTSSRPQYILPRQRLVLGGEATPWGLVDRLRALALVPGCLIFNHYGPTETTVGVITYRTGEGTARRQSETLPLGRPIANTQVYLLDAQLSLVSVGIPGELYIAGVGLARGYLNRPELTAERFIPNPFGEPGSRLYRTGDLARYLPDGNLEFLGRVDYQVKVRGFRIELGEIEARLLEHPEVRAAVVVAREDTPGDKRLVAYVVAREDGVAVEALRAYLKGVLPEYMVPLAFVFLEPLPLTPNGKVDRRALPVPDIAGQLARQYVAPRTSTEELLAGIWAEVLGLERVGIHDNFFEWGGDSIRSILLASRANEAGLKVTPRLLFQYQTIAELAENVAREQDSEHEDKEATDHVPMIPDLDARFNLVKLDQEYIDRLLNNYPNVEDIYPVTPLQEGMLFHTVLNPGTGIYHLQHRYWVEGSLDVSAFHRAWQEVVNENAIFRTAFIWEDGNRPHQVVHRNVAVRFDYMDWRELSESGQVTQLEALLHADLTKGFDLTQPSASRVYVIHLNDHRYCLIWIFHHILLDDWSKALVLADVLNRYDSLLRGKPHFTKGSRPFKDYIAWLERQDTTPTESFWQDYLSGFTQPTPLVPERLVRDAEKHGVADHITYLSVEDTRALNGLARQYRITPNTFVQGAWALTIAHYSNRSDVVFGVTVSGRPTDLEGSESVVGLFINALPLRVRIDAARPFIGWLKELFEDNLRVRQYEYVPLIKIQGWSEVQRGQALFQSLLVFENAPYDPLLAVENIHFTVLEQQGRVHTNYPLTLMVVPADALHLQLTYDRGLFDHKAVECMLGHFRHLLAQMVRNPHARIADLQLLPQDERQQLLIEWNATKADYRVDVPLSILFESQVQKMPEGIAAECGEERLSYRELNARANAIAMALLAREVGPDKVIAVLAERGLDLLTVILGIFKAGAAYFPLDPRHPQGRLTQIIESSRTPLILTQRSFVDRVDLAVAPLELASRPAVVVLESLNLTNRGGSEDPVPQGRPGNLAYVIYTSGSTGIPKGAMVERAGLLNNLLNKIPTLGLTSNDIIAQTASQCFDISIWQLLTGLLCGARVRVITDEIAQDPARLLKEINLRGVTVLESVPSLIDEMLNHGEDLQLSRLRWLLPTGEALSPECCRRWMARYPHVALLNAYGPAECSDDVAYYRVDSVPDEAALRVPIGKPVTNTHLYIVNRFFEPLPVGVAGELCVSGVSVGRGYLNDAVRTAEPFIPDPFSEEPGARLYKTGDLARYLPDGNIEFLGRVDDQVKVRGFRIELGEIEARLLEHPEVRAAVVVAREDTPGDKRLVAYVVSAAARPMVDGLRAHMKAVLPEYMVPAAFVFLEALPLTPNGKVDRNALPVPDVAGQLARQYVAPRTPTEELLARIWAEVLSLERVGIHDNFFELGGHSLLAMKVMSRLRMAFHVDIGLRRLFEVSTVEELAEVIEESLIEKLEALAEDRDFLDETRLRALDLEASDA